MLLFRGDRLFGIMGATRVLAAYLGAEELGVEVLQ